MGVRMIYRIGLSGKMCSGKSTIAKYLIDKYGFIQVAFADKLKEVCKDVFNQKNKDRVTLQQVGELMRRVNPNVWINYVLKHLPTDTDIIVPDVRYKNEADKLKQLGFTLIRVNVPDTLQRQRVKALYGVVDLGTFLHPSEVDLDNYAGFDYVIETSAVPSKTFKQIDKILKEIEKRGDGNGYGNHGRR